MDSLGHSTDAIGPFLHVNMISLLVYASKETTAIRQKKTQTLHKFMNLDIIILSVYEHYCSTYSFQTWEDRRGRPWGSPSASLGTLHWLSV